MIIARAQYDERPVLASDLSFIGDKGLTKQADARETDINLIMKRYEKTGALPDMIVRDGTYGDFSAVPDYQEALNIVMHAREQFDNLDAGIRSRFDNDPAKFLEFATDDKNYDEMEKMGLLKPEIIAARRAKIAEEAAAAQAAQQANEDAKFAEMMARIRAELAK